MMPLDFSDAFSILAASAALIAPLLVYLAARSRLAHDQRRGRSDDEAGLWERMGDMLNTYGRRADELEARVNAAEEAAEALRDDVSRLRVNIRRWREYAIALVAQIRGANLTPISPVDFDIHEDDI